MSDTSVQVKDLSVYLGQFEIQQISFAVERGDYYMILGPTGAGKTVLLETIAGIHQPDEGEIVLHGENMHGTPPEDRKVGFVYQDYALFPHLTVFDNVAYGLRARNFPEPEAAARDAIDLLELDHLVDRFPPTLSGGEHQKVAVARAIAYQPKLLLLDEPTAALDPQTKEHVRNELSILHRELDITTLHVTHDQSEAKILGDYIGILMEGRLKQTGALDDVFNRPVDEQVAEFVGVENILKGDIIRHEAGVAQIDVGPFDLSVISDKQEGRVTIYVRPEDIFLSTTPKKTSARNTVKGVVQNVRHLGQVYRISLDNGLSCYVTKQSITDLGLEKGKKVFASFKATAAQIR